MKINKDSALEVGCGPARNLIKLAKLYSDVDLYGLDASIGMLKTASSKIRRRKLVNKIKLKHCLAEDLNYKKTFGLNAPFDVIFYSYSLSMIPNWKRAIDASVESLKPGKTLLHC